MKETSGSRGTIISSSKSTGNTTGLPHLEFSRIYLEEKVKLDCYMVVSICKKNHLPTFIYINTILQDR